MKLCRFEQNSRTLAGFYSAEKVIPLSTAAEAACEMLSDTDDLLAFLPNGAEHETASRVADLFVELQKSEASTIIVVTHSEELAGRFNKQLVLSGKTLVPPVNHP